MVYVSLTLTCRYLSRVIFAYFLFHAVPMLSVILLILGVVLSAVSAVLWVSVGFHVGLQESELAMNLINTF